MAVSDEQGVRPTRPAREGFWAERRWDPLAPLTGIVGVALVIIGAIVFDSVDTPDETSTPAQILAYFNDEQTTIYVGSLLFALGLLFVVWFAATLRARLADLEAGRGRLASLVLAAATGMAVLLLAAIGFNISAAFAVDEDVRLAPDAAQALWVAGDGLFYNSWFMGGLFLAAAGIASLRTGLLPTWLGWLTLVLAVAAVVPWIGWAVFLFALPIWIIIVSILLWRRSPTVREVPPAAAPPLA